MLRIWLPILMLVGAEGAAKPPKLTVFIAVDALGSDTLQRIPPRLSDGLARLLSEGPCFPNAPYRYPANVTSPGHSTLTTGPNPSPHRTLANHLLPRPPAAPSPPSTHPP